jgi:hypothetical protein
MSSIVKSVFLLASTAAIGSIVSCSDSGSSGPSRAECRAACQHQRDACASTADLEECARDCSNEPWTEGYVDCKTQTCEGDGVCERWETSACYPACAHTRLVCNSGTGTIQECAQDCIDEPWPANYIECRTLTCEGDATCESWGR